jgi:hypothetical protein
MPETFQIVYHVGKISDVVHGLSLLLLLFGLAIGLSGVMYNIVFPVWDMKYLLFFYCMEFEILVSVSGHCV